MRATTQAPEPAQAVPGAARAAGAQLYLLSWWYPSPPKGSLPQATVAGGGGCQNSPLSWDGGARGCRRLHKGSSGWGKAPGPVASISCVWRAGKASLEGVRQHPMSLACDCRGGRLASTYQKSATGQQDAAWPGYKLIRCDPLAASDSNPRPQDQAMSPALSTG